MTQTLSNTIALDPVRLFLYGVTGSAKTTLVGMLTRYAKEEFCPLYVFDFDLRLGSLRATLSKEEMSLIDHDPYRDLKLQGEALTLAEVKLRELEAVVSRKECKYKTIVFDSATFLTKAVMNRVLFMDSGKPSTTQPTLPHYMALMMNMEEVVVKAIATGLHVIFTAHEDSAKDEVTGRVFKGVDLTGKSANKIPGYFNEFWHAEVRPTPGGDPEYVVRTRSDSIYAARTAYRTLLTVESQATIWVRVVKERETLRDTTQGPKA